MTVLILRHTAESHLGHLIQVLQEMGMPCRYRDVFCENPLEPVLPPDTRAMVILGGPMNVDETDVYPFLLSERRLIGQAVDRGIPMLGICLGAQMIARSLGARVRKNAMVEAGWVPVQLTQTGEADPVFSHLDSVFMQFQHHEDTFDLPEGASLLATSEGCLHQAFRVGKNVYGIQFHPELTQEGIEDCLQKTRFLTDQQKQAMLETTPVCYPAYRQTGRRLFQAFCNTCLNP